MKYWLSDRKAVLLEPQVVLLEPEVDDEARRAESVSDEYPAPTAACPGVEQCFTELNRGEAHFNPGWAETLTGAAGQVCPSTEQCVCGGADRQRCSAASW